MSRALDLAKAHRAPIGEVGKVVPMLCEREEAADRVLALEGYTYELKLDGVRIIADKRAGRVKLSYRTRRDATESYAEVAQALAALAEEHLVLDGEIVSFDEQGRPDFQRLAQRIGTRTSRVPILYVVFDVLAIGPYDLRCLPIEARREILAALELESPLLRVHPTFRDGRELFALCREKGLEGVVAKRATSIYRGERTSDWLKIKFEREADLVVIAWTEGEGTSSRARTLGALELGAYEGESLVFRGRVGSGLDAATIAILMERFVEVPGPVAEGVYPPGRNVPRHHVEPEIVVSVRYGGFTTDDSGGRYLRHPVFRGIRADIEPHACILAPLSVPPRRRVESASDPILGTTKGALADYFAAVAPRILRWAADRPITLSRPDGTSLWPAPKWTPSTVRTTRVRIGEREVRGYLLDSVDVLLFALEAGAPIMSFVPGDFAVLRGATQAATERVPQIAAEIGLPVAGIGGDVLVGLRGVDAKDTMAALLAKLGESSIVPVVPLPFTPLRSGAIAVPVAAGEIGRTFDLAAARARAEEDDPWAVLERAVDARAAAKKLERMILG